LSDIQCASKSSKVVQLKTGTSECDANLLEVISNKFEEISKDMKVQQETIESLKQEVANLSELFKKEIKDCITKVNEGA
jgi:polyhydroxyalkanoate synthesis regulator phasin